MNKQISPKIISITAVILVAVFAFVFYIIAWTEPSAAPPSANISSPINVGATTQYKLGALGVGGVFQADSLIYTATSTYLAAFGGNVGIGTANPTQKLDVVGTMQTIGFKMPIGAGVGKVLTSDVSGIGTWQAAVIPSGMIAMFDTACPSDWTCISCAVGQPLYQRVPRGSNIYGGIGGSDTHTHNFNTVCVGVGGCNPGAVPPTTAASSWPPYLNVIWCKKD